MIHVCDELFSIGNVNTGKKPYHGVLNCVCVCVPHTHTPYRVSGADRLGCPLFE